MSEQKYFSRLDSLRFFAFFAVFISHTTFFMFFPADVRQSGSLSNAFLQVGSLGVSFFFVLSGFLITHYLNKEYLSRQTISLKKFYLRRVLRIWPLYFLGLGLAFILSLTPVLNKLASVNYREFLAHLFLVGNWFRAFYGTTNEIVSVLWSVAVEEQFYLFWPVLFLLFRKNIRWVILLGILITFVSRWFYAHNYDVREYFSPCLVAYFMIGGFYAIYTSRVNAWLLKFKNSGPWVGIIWLLFILFIRGIIFKGNYPNWFAAIEPLLYGFTFILFINHAVINSQKPYFLSKILEYLGKISYGLYVFHMMALMIVKAVIGGGGWQNFTLVFCIAFVLTVVAAAISYGIWERPFLKLKHKFAFKEEVSLSY
jgi:peptidoglycan/LPS O-acetylase OafA/YrhL